VNYKLIIVKILLVYSIITVYFNDSCVSKSFRYIHISKMSELHGKIDNNSK